MNRNRRTFGLVSALALALSACAPSAAAPNWTYAPPAAPAASAAANAVAAAASMAGMPGAAPAGAVAAGGEIAIEAFDLGVTPKAVAVAAPGAYPVTFHNTGSTLHDVTFADGTKMSADPGATVKGTVTIPAGGITFLSCLGEPGRAWPGGRSRSAAE